MRTRLFLVLLLGACVPPELAPLPIVEGHDPDIRIGVLVDVHQATLGGGTLYVDDPGEGNLRTIAAGTALTIAPRGAMVSLSGSGARVERHTLIVRPADSGAAIKVNGRAYSGSLEVRRSPTGLVVVNVVSLERYLAGVVGAEMGPRSADEIEALKAQAVVSRTYALRNQGRWKARGFDLVGSVNDQAYTGQQSETPLAIAAVAATRGEVVTFNDQPIDAFFSSTCGGRTEDGTAAFAGARHSYLRSVDDRGPSGAAWCATSPRYHWKASWTAGQLAAILRKTLVAERLPGGRVGDLRDVRVDRLTTSGRIASVELIGRSGRTVLAGQAIRRVLSPPEGGLLWSTDFTIRVSRTGGKLERVDVDGRGNGHAVGMCQWGAIGRARAGQDYPTILSSYFPGTELQRLY